MAHGQPAEISPIGRTRTLSIDVGGTGLKASVIDESGRLLTDRVRVDTPVGSPEFATNWELSAARAINVTRFLQEQGLDPTILMAAAYGEYKPVAPNDSAEGKAKNRRIEIILVPKE